MYYRLSNGENIFLYHVTSKGQRSRSNPQNFEIEYLENGIRDRESVNKS